MKKRKPPKKKWGPFEVIRSPEGNHRVILNRGRNIRSDMILSDFETRAQAVDYAEKLSKGEATFYGD